MVSIAIEFIQGKHTIPRSSSMVPERVLGVTARRRLSLGLSACMLMAAALTLSNAAKFQFIGSKQLGSGDDSVKPNNTDGHGHGSQAVDIDPSQRESPSQAAGVVDDPLTAAYYPLGNDRRGNSSLPHSSGLRVAGDSVDPRPTESPSQAAVLDNPRAAYHLPGNGKRGNSSLSQTSDLRVVEHDTRDPSLLKSPSQAAVLDDPRATHYPPGVSTRGNSSLPHISGLRVAFVGDSLTRYMYLSLAAYLRRGRWVGEKDVPNILEGKQFPAWNPFYNYTNNYLQPYEQCDCFRLQGKAHFEMAIENRYFADPVGDNALYFFQKFGKMNASGHWTHQEVHSKQSMSDVYIEPRWSYNWTALITEHISKLTPKPKYLVFNAGLWDHDLGEAAVRDSIEQALNATNIVGIYKTTTFPRSKIANPANYKPHDAHVCKSMQKRCIDLSWTNNLSGSVNYVDTKHFRSHVNTAMNMQLLNLLNELE